MGGSTRRAGGSLPRLRRLVLSRNELRRPSDRIEGAIIALLVAAFLATVVAAACFAGHIYRSQAAPAARSRPTAAVPSRPGPVASQATVAEARWRRPGGTRRAGTQTTAPDPATYHVPAIYRVPPATVVRGWPGYSAGPRPLQPGRRNRVADALLAGIAIAIGAAVVLILCYRLCRTVLDRHRLAKWGAAWAVVGPQWTSRP